MNSKDIKIMFLNDDKDLVETLAEVFRKKGYPNAITATDSAEALKLFEQEKPQICVFDIVLLSSDLSGIDTWELIHKDNPDTICIFFSRNKSHYEDELKRAKAAGMFDYIEKPFSPLVLLPIVERAVASLNERKT